jgi:YfiH family protein
VDASVITVPAFASSRDGVRHFFGTRAHAEDMALDAGVPIRARGTRRSGWLLSVKQVHGTDALIVDRPLDETDRFHGGWDALVTDQPGVTVAVRTADCVPVLMYDRRRCVVAAIHAGWRGAIAGIVPKTIELIKSRFNVLTSDLRLAIGPSAGPCCYEVDAPVLTPLRTGLPDWRSVIRNDRGSTARLDLKKVIYLQAKRVGIETDQIAAINLCTVCHDDLFYSYRREGRVNGTMVSGIGLIPH